MKCKMARTLCQDKCVFSAFEAKPFMLCSFFLVLENETDKIDCRVDVKCEHEMHICATPKSCRWAPNQLVFNFDFLWPATNFELDPVIQH